MPEGETPEEDILDFYNRLDIPIEERGSIERLQTYLEEEMGFGDKQINALSSAWEFEFTELKPAGVTARVIDFGRYKDLRFAIKGYRGWFGFARMQEITKLTPEF